VRGGRRRCRCKRNTGDRFVNRTRASKSPYSNVSPKIFSTFFIKKQITHHHIHPRTFALMSPINMNSDGVNLTDAREYFGSDRVPCTESMNR